MQIPLIDNSTLEWVKNPLPFQLGSSAPSGIKRIIVLEGTASWCPPCRAAIPHLNALSEKYKDKEVHIVGCSREDEAVVKKFSQSMKYSMVCDAEEVIHEQVFAKLGMKGIPFAAIVDSGNKVVWHGHPMDPKFDQTLEKLAATASPRNSEPVAEKKALPPVTLSEDELSKLTIKELKQILEERKINMTGAVEKADLIKLVTEQASRVTFYK
jgi:thiol-disulfide isomerase/thioredoxin